MPALPPIEWRVHLTSSPAQVFEAWATDAGRERFWAERSQPTGDGFRLNFVGGEALDVAVAESEPGARFGFRYFGGSTVTVELAPDGSGGCELRLREQGVPDAEHVENYAGWVSVLLCLKAALDFNVDLRGHDPKRSWARRYVEN